MIRREWLRYDPLPSTIVDGERLIHSWDTATKAGDANDWSVCTVWRARPDGYRLAEVVRKRLEYHELRKEARRLALRDNPSAILIEDTGVGSALIADLRTGGLVAIAIRPVADKFTRLSIVAPHFESRRVVLPDRAHWRADLEAELFAFPQVRHDDQVDSISQALAWLSQSRGTPSIRRLQRARRKYPGRWFALSLLTQLRTSAFKPACNANCRPIVDAYFGQQPTEARHNENRLVLICRRSQHRRPTRRICRNWRPNYLLRTIADAHQMTRKFCGRQVDETSLISFGSQSSSNAIQ